MNAAQNTTEKPEEGAPSPSPQPEKSVQQPAEQPQYNPMAEIIERHENAVNRLKRGK